MCKRCGRYRTHIRSSLFFLLGGICILLAVLPVHLTLLFLLSSVLHECGHIAVMIFLKIPIRGFHTELGGAVLRGEMQAVSYAGELLTAAAGPAVNLLLVWLFRDFYGEMWRMLTAVNTVLAVYNLLPLQNNDGEVMLIAAAEMIGFGDGVRRVLIFSRQCLLAVLWMLGAWIFWYGALSDPGGASIGYGALFFCLLVRVIQQAGSFMYDTV